MNQENLDRKLDVLFADYRAACQDPEPSAEFMPQLWHKIEARQNTPFAIRRFAQMFVSMAAALTLLMGTLLFTPYTQAPATLISFFEAVEGAELDTVAYADVDVEAPGESLWQ